MLSNTRRARRISLGDEIVSPTGISRVFIRINIILLSKRNILGVYDLYGYHYEIMIYVRGEERINSSDKIRTFLWHNDYRINSTNRLDIMGNRYAIWNHCVFREIIKVRKEGSSKAAIFRLAGWMVDRHRIKCKSNESMRPITFPSFIVPNEIT